MRAAARARIQARRIIAVHHPIAQDPDHGPEVQEEEKKIGMINT